MATSLRTKLPYRPRQRAQETRAIQPVYCSIGARVAVRNKASKTTTTLPTAGNGTSRRKRPCGQQTRAKRLAALYEQPPCFDPVESSRGFHLSLITDDVSDQAFAQLAIPGELHVVKESY